MFFDICPKLGGMGINRNPLNQPLTGSHLLPVWFSWLPASTTRPVDASSKSHASPSHCCWARWGFLLPWNHQQAPHGSQPPLHGPWRFIPPSPIANGVGKPHMTPGLWHWSAKVSYPAPSILVSPVQLPISAAAPTEASPSPVLPASPVRLHHQAHWGFLPPYRCHCCPTEEEVGELSAWCTQVTLCLGTDLQSPMFFKKPFQIFWKPMESPKFAELSVFSQCWLSPLL